MSWIARIVMGLLGLMFLAGLIVALGGYSLFAAVRWLLTGRAPQVVLVWQRMRSFQSGAAWSMDAAGQTGEVVDVEVREVREPQHTLGAHGTQDQPVADPTRARLPHEPR